MMGVSSEELENHGDLYLQNRQPARALACYQEALARGADPHARSPQRWAAWMLLGCFEEAWKESDRIGRSRRHNTALQNNVFWDGRPLDGRSVIVHCYHGLGDTIQFIRYLPRLREICPRILVNAQPALLNLLEGAPGIDLLRNAWTDQPLPAFDAEIEIMELPYIFRSSLETIPSRTPYLCPEGPRLASARRLLESVPRSRVGIVWEAGGWNSSRTIPLARWRSLLFTPNTCFFSLQFGKAARQLRNHRDLPLVDLAPFITDIADMAAVIRNLDLVITADTMAAHLAGALGCPVWLLLPYCCDWRWMLQRDDSPWYPTMRILRQPAPGDWHTPIYEAARKLRTLAEASSAHVERFVYRGKRTMPVARASRP